MQRLTPLTKALILGTRVILEKNLERVFSVGTPLQGVILQASAIKGLLHRVLTRAAVDSKWCPEGTQTDNDIDLGLAFNPIEFHSQNRQRHRLQILFQDSPGVVSFKKLFANVCGNEFVFVQIYQYHATFLAEMREYVANG